jgi:hypothetical protein
MTIKGWTVTDLVHIGLHFPQLSCLPLLLLRAMLIANEKLFVLGGDAPFPRPPSICEKHGLSDILVHSSPCPIFMMMGHWRTAVSPVFDGTKLVKGGSPLNLVPSYARGAVDSRLAPTELFSSSV